MIDAPTIELHETVIRLAKGIVSARERWERSNPGSARSSALPFVSASTGGALTGMIEQPTSTLKAAIGVWENWLALERQKLRSA